MATTTQLEQALVAADQAGDTKAAQRLAEAVRVARSPQFTTGVAGMPTEMPPQTTITGLQGAVTRGAALPAMGAAVGAAMGAPIAGVGAIPGAMAGAGAATLVQLIGDPLISSINHLLGTHYTIPSDAMADWLSRLGVAEPRTAAERILEQTVAGAASMGGIAAAGKAVASTARAAAKPTAQAIGRTLAADPMAQITGGAGAGAAGQTAQEMGAGPVGGTAATIVGGIAGAMAPATLPRVAARAGEAVLERMVPQVSAATETAMAATGKAATRIAQAEQLPVPIRLTQGQASRTFQQQRFEREIAKLPGVGEPLRERFAQQNEQLAQNFDRFVDMTGAQSTDLPSVGAIVDKALRTRAARDKIKIRSLYKEAEKAGEMEAPVVLDELATFLTEATPEAAVANILPLAQKKAIQLGILMENEVEQFVAQPASLQKIELLRRAISNGTNAEPTNIKFARDLKKIIDTETEGAGGALYKKARAARAEYANDYENTTIVKRLLTSKRGTSDRNVALEHVLNRTVLDPTASVESLRKFRRLLQTAGEEGRQAWRELQGGTVQYLKDQALKSASTDQYGNRVFSATQLDRTITKLDQSGKLDLIFGSKGAGMLRTVNDVAKVVTTSPPGAVNTSNTATVLAGLIDTAISGTAGVPLPLVSAIKFLTRQLKDKRLQAKVREALREND